MSVSGVNPSGAATVLAGAQANAANSKADEPNVNSLPNKDDGQTEVDSFVKSKPEQTTYTRDTAKIAELNASQKAYISNLQSLVSSLVNQIGKNQIADGEGKFSYAYSNGAIDPSRVESYWDLLVDNGDGTFSLDPSLSAEDQGKIIAQAQKDIGEDGYYGVKQTSQRILDFAKAITGGDPSKIDLMRKMAERAFGDVSKLVGGKLPDISQQTYDAVMKGFDEWAESAKASA
ncbi:MAG: hypothetical protein FWH16_00495 [Oscillospiraceae bacterium]|nr:hypothetical protein [Oscillospiraceae bacterium]